MSQQVDKHVFISYSRKDDKVMNQVVERLRSRGIKVWIDNEKLIPGTAVWEEEVAKAIKIASGIVVVLSPEAKSSKWVSREITLADQNEKLIVPVLIRGDEHSSIPFRLVNHQYIDMRNNQKAGLDDLVDALSKYLGHTSFQAENKTSHFDETARKTPKQAAQDAKLNAILEEIDRKAAERAAREKAEANRSTRGFTTSKSGTVAVPAAQNKGRAGWFMLATLLFFASLFIGLAAGDQNGLISSLIGTAVFIITLVIGSKSK
jgi:TIR domain